jgi:hypothetical protein
VDQEELSRSWGPARYARRLPAVKIPGSIYDPGRQDGFSIAQFINANIDRAPIVVCGGFKPGDGSVTKAAYRVVPVGLCSEVLRANAPFAFNEWLDRSRALLPDVAAFAATPPRPAMFEYLALADYWNAWHARAYFVRSCEDCGLSPDERLRRFADMAEEIIRLGPSPPIEVYKNLAAVLLRLYATRPEVKDRLVAALQAYMKAAPADDRDLPAIRDALAKLK